MPIEIRELQIKATVLAQGDALLFGTADAAGKGRHAGGINVVMADGSVRATDSDAPPIDAAFAAQDTGPEPVDAFTLNNVTFRMDYSCADAADAFGLF